MDALDNQQAGAAAKVWVRSLDAWYGSFHALKSAARIALAAHVLLDDLEQPAQPSKHDLIELVGRLTKRLSISSARYLGCGCRVPGR